MSQSGDLKHIAIIMDGNGRWAQARGLPRTQGHRKGAESVQKVITAAIEKNISYITLFGFSSENWKRPDDEVKELMSLLRIYMKREMKNLQKTGAKLRVIGDRSQFDDDLILLFEEAEDLTKNNDKIHVTMALSYGGRQEICYAAKKLVKKCQAGTLNIDDIDEALFSKSMMTADLPDPDLVIRSSGETRISNFLLWQSAYSEFHFTETLWPDFDAASLQEAIDYYYGRDRRYGGIKEQAS